VLGGDLVEEVSNLKATVAGNIVVHGSGQLARALVENDLVDEVRLMVFPVVLGSGKRLFESGSKKRLRLTGTTTIGDGVVLLTYEHG
jgi:dihydrofolate reductase